ncbi:hypothetical protein [Segetibacter koreensis]|uniref:hypothetical protein n=1 Tax=Segetibacter koreensis TaxID=398037 RepID=UPI000378AD21|nr:hypothetical protein [Segetibacter koreensis]
MKQLISLLLLLTVISNAKAYQIKSGDNVVINTPFYDNLYVAGGTVTIDAPIYGDLIIAGGNITINDSVANDVLLAGGTATINGNVGDDIRCAGGQMYVRKNVGGELFVTGGRIEIDKDVIVNKGLMSSGGNIIVNGTIKGNANAFGGNIVFNGIAEKGLDCRGGQIEMNGTVMGKTILAAQQIAIGNNASFNNDVRYWDRRGTLDFRQSVKNGSAIFDPSLKVTSGEWYFFGFATIIGLLWYVGMALLMIALVQYLFSRTMQKSAETVFNTAVKSAGYGLLFLISVPIATIILMVTVIGIPIAIMLASAYIMLILLSTVITSVVASNWINNRYKSNWKYRHLVFTAFGVFIVLKVVSYTPFFGPLVMLALVCTAFGAILLNINWKRKQQNNIVHEEPIEYAT